MPRYVLEVMYDGTRFHGSQVQGTQQTVQLALNNTLSMVFRRPVATFGASRTDEGVHALCNYYHFDLEQDLDFDLKYKCNSILSPAIAIKRICTAAPDFNARFDALSRRYRYRIYARKNPFLVDRAMYYPFRPDETILQETARILLQHTCFETFAKRNTQSKTFDCHLVASRWERAAEELHYVVEANRFLRGMVRGLVATQLQAARGRISLQQFQDIIMSHDSKKAYFDVPGHGLYLEYIHYKEGTLVPCNSIE